MRWHFLLAAFVALSRNHSPGCNTVIIKSQYWKYHYGNVCMCVCVCVYKGRWCQWNSVNINALFSQVGEKNWVVGFSWTGMVHPEINQSFQTIYQSHLPQASQAAFWELWNLMLMMVLVIDDHGQRKKKKRKKKEGSKLLLVQRLQLSVFFKCLSSFLSEFLSCLRNCVKTALVQQVGKNRLFHLTDIGQLAPSHV